MHCQPETSLRHSPGLTKGKVEDVLEIPLVRLDSGLPLPRYAHPDDAGLDLYSVTDLVLGPGERQLVGTGIALAIPAGYVGLVHPRSGLAIRAGLSIVNAPGTVDAGYRGEIKVALINLDPQHPISLQRGDRIAQLLIQPVERVTLHEVTSLSSTSRGVSGHGSTGGFSEVSPT